MALAGLGVSEEEDTCGRGCGEAVHYNPKTTPLPLPQISELNKRMSAVEHLLVHLENVVLPPSDQVIPRAKQDQPHSLPFREAEVLSIASREESQRSCSWFMHSAPWMGG